MERTPYWETLAFESEVLGVPSARILPETTFSESALSTLMADLRRRGMKFVSCRIPDNQTEGASALENAGFNRIETQLKYRRALEPALSVKGQGRVVLARTTDEMLCIEIARKAFVYDRFHSDPLIDREKADALKARWTQNSLHGRADACLVIPSETETTAGFVLCMRNGEDAVIDLIAVDPDHYGKGLGKALVSGALAHYRGQATGMRVGTQGTNNPSISLYESMNFVLQEKMATYHWHETGASS